MNVNARRLSSGVTDFIYIEFISTRNRRKSIFRKALALFSSL
jgi:hypothetical protein